MLTRLRVNGFKNLVDVDVSFGPFTCIAGANGVGKSNLFDAIAFLAALAEKPLMEAALSVRGEGGKGSDLRSLFYHTGDRLSDEISFDAEMLVPATGVDDLGQEARSDTTFIRYGLTLGLRAAGLTILREELQQIYAGEALGYPSFPHAPVWRESVVKPVVTGRRRSPFIRTERRGGETFVKLADGILRVYTADRLPRSVLSNVSAADSPTAVLVRREMQSWRLLQLEPSALRSPDSFTSPRSLSPNGNHLPATLARLAGLDLAFPSEAEDRTSALYARVANRLSELIEGVRSVRVDVDPRRELLTLMLTDRDGTELEARSLSDGTLRFLALAVLESDPEAQGVLCMEEPENGIHPQRIPAMLRLLQDLVVDPTEPVSEDNPLRQVIANTHSPAVAAQVPDDSLLVAVPQLVQREDGSGTVPAFRWLPDTWRERAFPDQPTLAKGQIISYLNPLEPSPTGLVPSQSPRVMVVPYRPERFPEEEMRRRARSFYEEMDRRRSVRFFSPDPVPRELIELAIRTASTAPSGAHRQPWWFVAVDDPQIKKEIREAAEAEERQSYEGGRMPPEWLETLKPFGTSWEKPYLETAPWLVVVFEELYGLSPDGEKRKNYYPKESVGLACGLFIAALHHMGLVTLTHTPSPMAFLSRILGRPANEKPFILFPVGYPAANAEVPDLRRKGLEEVAVWNPRLR